MPPALLFPFIFFAPQEGNTSQAINTSSQRALCAQEQRVPDPPRINRSCNCTSSAVSGERVRRDSPTKLQMSNSFQRCLCRAGVTNRRVHVEHSGRIRETSLLPSQRCPARGLTSWFGCRPAFFLFSAEVWRSSTRPSAWHRTFVLAQVLWMWCKAVHGSQRTFCSCAEMPTKVGESYYSSLMICA